MKQKKGYSKIDDALCHSLEQLWDAEKAEKQLWMNLRKLGRKKRER